MNIGIINYYAYECLTVYLLSPCLIMLVMYNCVQGLNDCQTFVRLGSVYHPLSNNIITVPRKVICYTGTR
jgi:hypothetical protein